MNFIFNDNRLRSFAFLILLIAALMMQMGIATASPEPGQKVFDSPQKAFQALVDACRNNDTKAFMQLFGNEHDSLISNVDPTVAKKRRAEFYTLSQQKMKIENEGDNKAVLIVGRNQWPFPVPVIKEKSGWRFDSATGRKEILFRIVGENEIGAIEACLAYPMEQREYGSVDRDGDGVVEYAQKIRSAPGKMDGLFWEKVEGGEESPIGKFLAMAGVNPSGEKDKPAPFSGYYFKILTKQGPDAPGGQYDYVINGHMVAGFALLAYPAHYESTGIKTFMINQSGVIYEKDLGEKTTEIAQGMIEFNPDKTWIPLNK